MKLVIASNNKGKIREYKAILEPLGYEVMSQSEAGLDIEAEETGATFFENAEIKARAAFERLRCAVLADDSGLEVDQLNGEPGVYSARYHGIDNDKERCELILKKLDGVPEDKRTARFVCVIYFINGEGKAISAAGYANGSIGFEPLGENGFGYDPIFMYDGKSFAQMDSGEKNKVSHRAQALEKFKKLLEDGDGLIC